MLPIAAVGEIPRSSKVLTKAIVFPISPRLPVHYENSNDTKTTKTKDVIFFIIFFYFKIRLVNYFWGELSK